MQQEEHVLVSGDSSHYGGGGAGDVCMCVCMVEMVRVCVCLYGRDGSVCVCVCVSAAFFAECRRGGDGCLQKAVVQTSSCLHLENAHTSHAFSHALCLANSSHPPTAPILFVYSCCFTCRRWRTWPKSSARLSCPTCRARAREQSVTQHSSSTPCTT